MRLPVLDPRVVLTHGTTMVEEALSLLPRAVGLLAQAEDLVRRAGDLVERIEVTRQGADAVVVRTDLTSMFISGSCRLPPFEGAPPASALGSAGADVSGVLVLSQGAVAGSSVV